MALLLRGGIPVPRALSVTAPLLTVTAAKAIADVQRGVSEGRPLSECLDDAGLSTEVSSRLIRAGERNGQLADMLERVAHFHDEEVSRWLERFMKLFEPILMAVMGLIIGGI
jgi:general secretion pathway protein F